MEENNAFDAEMYADELDIQETIDFREDQRSKSLLSKSTLPETQILTMAFSKSWQVGAEISVCKSDR